jgi:hypothetical protein
MASCKGCNHRDREAIDAAIIQGASIRTICDRFGLSVGGAQRHKQHVAEFVKAAATRESPERASDLLARIEEVVKAARGIAARAVRTDDLRAANGALGTLLRALETVGKLTGELQTPGAGIHFHAGARVSNTTINVGDDCEIAELLREATDGWSESTIARFKLLAPAMPEQSASEVQPDVPSQAAINPTQSET